MELALVIGTGYLDALRSLEGAGARLEPLEVSTQDGTVSDGLWRLSVGAARAIVLARHGARHSIPPHRIAYRANLRALAALGVTHVASFTSVGTLNPRIAVGTFILPDDFYDAGHGVVTLFDAEVRHTQMAQPFDPALVGLLAARLRGAGARVLVGGTYCGIPGPRYPTRAEARQLARVATVSGMTVVPEVILARELGLRYANCSLITDDGPDTDHERISAAAPASRLQAGGVLGALPAAFAAWSGEAPGLAERVRQSATARVLRLR